MPRESRAESREAEFRTRGASLPAPGPRPATLASLRRYFTIYAALWKNSIVREMGFKANFLLWIVVELLW